MRQNELRQAIPQTVRQVAVSHARSKAEAWTQQIEELRHRLDSIACLVLGAEVSGCKVETIEGMADGEHLHPLQTKFLEHAALQCGICTPGILVAAKALLEQNDNPTETEVRYWLAGNLCRCTGYDKIIRAVLDAAAEMRGA